MNTLGRSFRWSLFKKMLFSKSNPKRILKNKLALIDHFIGIQELQIVDFGGEIKCCERNVQNPFLLLLKHDKGIVTNTFRNTLRVCSKRK